MNTQKTSKRNSRKAVAVIRNEHTKAEMNALDDEWLNASQPIMTLAETLAYAAERDKKRITNTL